MSLVFFGTAEFAVPALRALKDHVHLLVSQPDRPTGRGMKLQPSPTKLAAMELGIPVLTPEKARAPEFVETIEAIKPDALIVAAYGQILSERLLNSAKRGGINLHGSILPDYRGAAPIQRAILEGRAETGVTLMQMDKGMDSGDIIEMIKTPIGADETYSELQERLALMSAEMIVEWLPRLVTGDYPRSPQDHDQATFAPKVERSETQLKITSTATEAYNRFRAFTSTPGVTLNTVHGPARLLAVRPVAGEGTPGTVLALKPELTVAFAQGALAIHELVPSGKRPMAGNAYANGIRLKPGDVLCPQESAS